MQGDGRAARALLRLDAEVARAIHGRSRVVLAFSGGLASLLLAALARKRCELTSVVVGFRGSADVQAALVAQTFLDYPVTVVRPTEAQLWETAGAVRASSPSLPVPEILDLLPLVLVEENRSDPVVLSGFGLTAHTTTMRRALKVRQVSIPGSGLSVARSPRASLVRLAQAAGLPESFVLAARRSPREGSGIGPVLRARAHARHTSLARLLSRPVAPRDNH